MAVDYSELFCGAYAGRRVFVTGHTGFKGSWLALWLHQLGAEVTGFAFDPDTTPSHSSLLHLPIVDRRGDIRDREALGRAIGESDPEIVFHLAAQPLVRRSYREPLETWSTNVVGTANVLDACRQARSLKAVVAVTTDKVYANREWLWGYREIDPLGGRDPYSASKAASEFVVDSFRDSYLNQSGVLVASGRAGNVIGGGDWSEDRLIPDLVRAVSSGEALEIRSPKATRPWQHVLETLAGYLQLGERLLAGDVATQGGWNFGPAAADNQPVGSILNRMEQHWPALRWHVNESQSVHEANFLFLDSSKARAALQWAPVWNLDRALLETARWYRAHLETGEVITGEQLRCYVEDATSLGTIWASRA